jgi:hypothetical protein
MAAAHSVGVIRHTRVHPWQVRKIQESIRPAGAMAAEQTGQTMSGQTSSWGGDCWL